MNLKLTLRSTPALHHGRHRWTCSALPSTSTTHGGGEASTDCVLSLLRAANAEVTYKKRLRLTLLHAADGRAQPPPLLLLCRRDIQAAPAVGTTGESGGI